MPKWQIQYSNANGDNGLYSINMCLAVSHLHYSEAISQHHQVVRQ